MRPAPLRCLVTLSGLAALLGSPGGGPPPPLGLATRYQSKKRAPNQHLGVVFLHRREVLLALDLLDFELPALLDEGAEGDTRLRLTCAVAEQPYAPLLTRGRIVLCVATRQFAAVAKLAHAVAHVLRSQKPSLRAAAAMGLHFDQLAAFTAPHHLQRFGLVRAPTQPLARLHRLALRLPPCERLQGINPHQLAFERRVCTGGKELHQALLHLLH